MIYIKQTTSLLEREDVFLLLVPVGDITVAVGEVDRWFVVVGCIGVLRILIEAHLPFVQHAVQVDPGPAVVGEEGEGGGNKGSQNEPPSRSLT